jgi:hypothetical protein
MRVACSGWNEGMHSLYAGNSSEDAPDRLLSLLPAERQPAGEKPP